MTSSPAERAELERGLAALSLEASPAQLEQWLQHLALLRRWSKSFNLVAPGELNQLVPRHLLDSLSIARYLSDGALLDVGSGAGFPGIPLAVLRPELPTLMVDSAGKKVRFLRQVIRSAGLPAARAEHARIERFSEAMDFRTITSRAFSSLADFAASVRHLAGPQTRLLAMKGQLPEAELKALPSWAELNEITALSVPGVEAERHLVELRLRPDRD